MKNFIFEKMIIKKYCPSDIVELVNAKFASNIDRKTISNYLSRINSDLFGSSDSEFKNLISLLNEMEKMGFENYFDFKYSEDLKIQNIFLSNSKIIKQFNKFNDVLICDTTFGTNRLLFI